MIELELPVWVQVVIAALVFVAAVWEEIVDRDDE